MLSVMAYRKKLTPFVILNRKNLLKERIFSGIIFKHNGKGWMTQELIFEWLREVWDRRAGSLLKKRD
jgi:DDE superfamily endonuclease.